MKNDSKKYYNLTCSNTNHIRFKPEVRFFVLVQNSVYLVVLSFLLLFSPKDRGLFRCFSMWTESSQTNKMQMTVKHINRYLTLLSKKCKVKLNWNIGCHLSDCWKSSREVLSWGAGTLILSCWGCTLAQHHTGSSLEQST